MAKVSWKEHQTAPSRAEQPSLVSRTSHHWNQLQPSSIPTIHLCKIQKVSGINQRVGHTIKHLQSASRPQTCFENNMFRNGHLFGVFTSTIWFSLVFLTGCAQRKRGVLRSSSVLEASQKTPSSVLSFLAIEGSKPPLHVQPGIKARCAFSRFIWIFVGILATSVIQDSISTYA